MKVELQIIIKFPPKLILSLRGAKWGKKELLLWGNLLPYYSICFPTCIAAWAEEEEEEVEKEVGKCPSEKWYFSAYGKKKDPRIGQPREKVRFFTVHGAIGT